MQESELKFTHYTTSLLKLFSKINCMTTLLHLHEHREDKGNMPAHYEDATCRKQRTQGTWEIFMSNNNENIFALWHVPQDSPKISRF